MSEEEMTDNNTTDKNWFLLNGLALAYIGDAAYEVFIRQHLLEQGWTKPKDLHRRATQYVSAPAQAMLMGRMLEEGFLSEEETDTYRRGRNAKSHSKAKNTDVETYRISTGFEALMGYLHLTGQKERLEELAKWCIRTIEETSK